MTKMSFFFFFEKVRENETRKMTSRTRKQVTLHFKRCGLKKYCKMKCLMTPMSGIELCHALTIEFYNANSHLVVCRLKYLGFQYYHEWKSGSIYVRKV